MKRSFLPSLALAALLLTGCGPKEDQFVDVKSAAAQQASGVLILDVRAEDDYKEFHIPGSLNIPYGKFKQRMAELEAYKNKPIIVTDHAGVRAPRAWEDLKKAGFSQVRLLKGGAAEWRKEKLPIETLEMQLEKQRKEEEKQLLELMMED